jgi:hypothetical protein
MTVVLGTGRLNINLDKQTGDLLRTVFIQCTDVLGKPGGRDIAKVRPIAAD